MTPAEATNPEVLWLCQKNFELEELWTGLVPAPEVA